ncbi:ROK family protein [Streptomyces sp. NPDC059740]|uniref:ROK family transcriptional regulator n=1 Tax=Streptomyces sp. NPDC059740 TaxID=3346926 RepID=UPI00365141E7
MPSPTADTQRDLRRRNLSRVLRSVIAQGPVSRATVAGRVGLTRAAVSTLVEELRQAGLVVEAGRAAPSGRGRPGNELVVTPDGPVGLGAEIGVDHLAVVAVDLGGRVRWRREVEAANRDSRPAPVLARLAALVGEATTAVSELGLHPVGLAVAVPGLVARDTSTVVHAPNLTWRDVDVAAALSPTVAGRGGVVVDNEANFGALAELGGPAGEGGPAGGDFLHVSAEVGIGGAVVVGGELLRGTRGFAGELGHVPVWPDGRPCRCGRRGCLEGYAGEQAVLRAAGITAEAAAVQAPGPRGRTALLARRAEEGDVRVLRALRHAGQALGIALSSAVNLLDPRTVVLGGALAHLAPWLLPSLERELHRRSGVAAGPGEDGPAVGVAVSRWGADGPLIGAARRAVETVLTDPLGSFATPDHASASARESV